jgi:hypothetical protein
MIPYEELCAALERHRGDHGAAAPETHEPPTGQTAMPPLGGGDEEHTAVGNMQPIYEDRSNELDIGDVLSDEEAPKS